ncbi:permease [Flavobacteriaceae bacterium Ap0902]|nr:permease [Flavobacteriaceae bacterium Ap0902]
MNQQNLFLEATTTEESRVVFYRKTYMHVALAVLLFVAVEYVLLQIDPLVNFMLSLTEGYLWLALLGGFWVASTFATNLSYKLDKSAQYAGLFIYVLAEAIIFVPILYFAVNYSSPAVLNQAASLTAFLFIGLSAVAMFSKKDFSFLRSILTIGFFVAIGLIVAGLLFGFNLGLWFSVGMILLAAGSILYQTSQLKNHYQPDQYVGAAVGLFAALMTMFWYILRIFMSRD